MARFPARFQLVLAANPCPCGNFAGRARACVCAPSLRQAYIAKLSGPLLDRIDIRLRLQSANPAQVALARLGAKQVGRSSLEVRNRVTEARANTKARLTGTPWSTNAQIPGSYLRKQLRVASEITAPLDRAVDSGALSMRGYDRCLRIAWSCADLDGRGSVSEQDIAVAVILRGGDGVSSW